MSNDKQDHLPPPGTRADAMPMELAYLPPPAPFYVQEGLREKLIRKTKENPFVPLGLIFTTVVLGIGISTLRTGNSRKGQLMMRLRVGGQAFAIFAMLGGVYYNTKFAKKASKEED